MYQPQYKGFFYLVGMRRVLTILFLSAVFTGIHGQLPPEDPHWHLVFDEPFDSLDRSFWTVANDFDHYGEPQVYTDRNENVYVEDGKLMLQVRKERYRCRDLQGGACNKSRYDYTSGWVETAPLIHSKYGYMESRIRIPHGYGFWPAFWTFISDDAPDPRNAAEIDVFEMLGDLPKTVMGTNLHLAYCNCNENQCDCKYLNDQMCPEVNPDILCHQMDVNIPDYTENFLTYGLEWTPSKIIWYVNGAVVRNAANPGIHDPVRIIFNLAITPWRLPNETTPFPSVMEIDYLRVYELDGDHQSIDAIAVDFRTVGDFVKDTIVIGGDGGISSIPESESITLRATKSIEIRGDFSVPLGAQLYMDVNEIE